MGVGVERKWIELSLWFAPCPQLLWNRPQGIEVSQQYHKCVASPTRKQSWPNLFPRIKQIKNTVNIDVRTKKCQYSDQTLCVKAYLLLTLCFYLFPDQNSYHSWEKCRHLCSGQELEPYMSMPCLGQLFFGGNDSQGTVVCEKDNLNIKIYPHLGGTFYSKKIIHLSAYYSNIKLLLTTSCLF